jgi:hypothetical protein
MSIKTNELRLGNFVFDDENIPMQIAKLETEKYTDWNSGNTINAILEKDGQYYESDIMNYIPLTEKWLLDFGFVRHHNDYFNSVLIIKNVVDFENGNPNSEFEFKVFPKTDLQSASDIMNSKKIKFVHELQNLYCSLTGIELSVS